MDLQVISLAQADKWLELLNACYQYDFYHCPSYHEVSLKGDIHEANLFAYQEGDFTIAIPLIIKPVHEIEGCESIGYNDATSVYGYAGPVASHPEIPGGVIKNFQANLEEYLKEHEVICVFSRLHPLITQEPLLEGFGNVKPIGQTISIDLGLTSDEQYSRYRRSHKYNIGKLRALGVRCTSDDSAEYLDEFIDMYHENMRRVNASEDYYFDKAYFNKLLGASDFEMHLFACLLDDDVICSGLFSLCNGIVQAYLAGTRNKYLGLAPMKLLIDEVRIWANEAGASCFHLGGGLGAEEDTLFKFKCGFSDTVHTFKVWQLVVREQQYRESCSNMELLNKTWNRVPLNGSYFPAYRSPTT